MRFGKIQVCSRESQLAVNGIFIQKSSFGPSKTSPIYCSLKLPLETTCNICTFEPFHGDARWTFFWGKAESSHRVGVFKALQWIFFSEVGTGIERVTKKALTRGKSEMMFAWTISRTIAFYSHYWVVWEWVKIWKEKIVLYTASHRKPSNFPLDTMVLKQEDIPTIGLNGVNWRSNLGEYSGLNEKLL